MNKLLVTFVSTLLIFSLFSQDGGNYFIKNFDQKTSGLNGQAWTGIEDNNGILYFASGTKISMYDGRNWTSIQLTNQAPPLSFCKNDLGTIFVGGVGEIGYLKPNKQGLMEYVSLKNKAPKETRDFQNVWTCVSDGRYVYYATDNGIFSWNGAVVKFIAKPVFMTLNKIGNQVLFCSPKEGLLEIDNGIIKPLKNGKVFNNIPIVGGVKLSDSEILFLTGKDPVMIYNSKTGEINASRNTFLTYNSFLSQAYVYSVEKTINNKIVIGTINQGALIFDMVGNFTSQITTKTGLLNNAINKVINDRMGNIWLCTDKGVARIEINSGIKNWGQNEGIDGTVEDVIAYNNTLYVATAVGVKYLKDGLFVPIEGVKNENWQFLNFNKRLFLGNANGLYEINHGQKTATNLFNKSTVWCMNQKDNQLILGCSDGIYLYNIATKFFIQLVKTKSAIRSIALDQSQRIWFATENTGVGYIDANKQVTLLGRKQGLQFDSYNQVFTIQNKVYVATKAGLFSLNHSKNKLVKSCEFGEFMCKDVTGVFRIKEFGKNMIFTSTYGDNSARFSCINLKNKYRDTLNLKQLPKMHIYSFCEKNNIIWLGTPFGLYQYNKKEIRNVNFVNKALIRQVFIGKDSLLFGGSYLNFDERHHAVNGSIQSNKLIPKVNYDLNAFNFVFTNPFFNNEDKILYQYKLEGFDEEWSSWSADNFKSYTNLFEGKYTFMVRAQNVFGEVSEIGIYSFRITPPWYRTIYSYTAYVLIFVYSIYSFVRMYTRRLREANIRLENIVKERTAEVVKQRDEIQEKNGLITESIEYAKTIQEAIITSDEYFRNIFKDLFILFKPKDIVSGDFYWGYKTKSNKVFWVAADCTGHGVPGAFMTMIGMSLLNEIIIENEVEETDEILNQLRESVIKTLNKNVDLDSDEKMRNGMDIAICCWDMTSNTLSYSGANNPMYVFRAGELIEFKADKQPIGIYKKMTPFTKHTLELQKGDKIYTFSDGYADQMNEEENRFKIANLKKAILEVGSQPTISQKEFFDTTYENWRGNYEQMDDVVLIGVEI
jgi:serine phosphatase RsbU (regulator of sigma subunit)/ligand-binding sensor domain-containing protein